MTAVTLLLQTVFSLLVIVALGYGVRLNRKLVELRDGQAKFADAVGELDRAAARAEAGLLALRQATDTAETDLTHRIDIARALAGKLETLTSDAALALKRLEATQTAPAHPLTSPLRGEVARSDGGAAPGARAEAADDIYEPSGPPARPLRPSGPPPHAAHGEETVLLRPDPTPTEDSATRLRRVADLLRAPADPRAKASAGARR